MAITGTINLTSTFDDWRQKTNETIVAYNYIEGSTITINSLTSNTFQANGVNSISLKLNDSVNFSVNALPTTGGTVNGTVNLNSLVANTDGLFLGGTRILTNGHIIMI